ncbi:hypothetical protein [Neisseria dentiae]|uniref:hypothetical protein n=1 Tax=Neisseria dentiae TaxID=194197 RepID=UPI00359F9DFC
MVFAVFFRVHALHERVFTVKIGVLPPAGGKKHAANGAYSAMFRSVFRQHGGLIIGCQSAAWHTE